MGESTLDDPIIEPEDLSLLIGVEPITLSRNELHKLLNSAFKANMSDHGRSDVDLNWASSLFKLFWGLLKQSQREKLQALRQKQKDHIDYITENPAK